MEISYGAKITLPPILYIADYVKHTHAGYRQFINLLARKAGKVEFTPISPATHLPNYKW
jgi:hypothetical protein